jgi:2-polyprenyl-3-methyl-5-hydroxy-6-metoxy-1,4-benzoquinol methylase
MKLRNEHLRSYIDDPRYLEMLRFFTFRGEDIAPAWFGAHEPATRSNDSELHYLAEFSRCHYLFYRALIEKYVDREGEVLDVGCGSGQRTMMLGRYAKHVVGIDNDVSKIGGAINLNNGTNTDWALGEFTEWAKKNVLPCDYVFAVEVIEHVPLDKQAEFIGYMVSVVKPGGRLLITTPRDKVIERKHPHIGLWDDTIAAKLVGDIGGTIEYFRVASLLEGGDNPWSDKESSSHYVVVVNKPDE